MEISADRYEKFSGKVITIDEKPEDVRRSNMRLNFQLQCGKIEHRYNNQNLVYHEWNGWYRDRSYTSKQKRRMRKQKNKWHRRMLGKF